MKSLESREENGHKKEKTEGATRPGRITREKMEKWNQMTALRFQTGGGGASLQGLLGGVLEKVKWIEPETLQ